MNDCEVCQALKRTDNTIKDYTFWQVALDPTDQYYLGRRYFTLHRHCGDLAELTDEEWQELKKIITVFERSARQALGATLFNFSCLMNNAYQTQPYNPHIHWHVRPRYGKKVIINNEKFVDKEFGHHYARSTNRQVSPETINEIVKILQKEMNKADVE